MKNKCDYHEVEYAKFPNPITGRLYSQRIEHCLRVNENDLCSCGGDKTKCSFPERKIEMITEQIPCQYCEERNNDFVLLNDTGMYSGIDFEINRQGMLRVRVFNDEMDGFVTQDILNVRYCPMCGREFNN